MMKSEGKNTLCNGNIPRGRREKGERNKITRIIEIIGKENYEQICRKHAETALYSDDAQQKSSAQRFIMNLGASKEAPIPHQTYIDIPLLPMRSLENIKENEDTICKHISNGSISLEEGEKLFAITDKARRSWECTEGARLYNEIKQSVDEIKSR